MIADTMHAALTVIKREMPPPELREAIASYEARRCAIRDGRADDAEFLRLTLTRHADRHNINHYAFLQALGLHADGLAERITTNAERRVNTD